MAQVITAKEIYGSGLGGAWTSYIPAALAFIGGLAMLFARVEVGANFPSDGALMMVALACYIIAAL
ncbi:MAG TPA: hypothetical protein VL572_10915, partial [Pyrinomonadaceae bacterium]|nr:hypothetical protein [Pyrinomonadaceae bacterium]